MSGFDIDNVALLARLRLEGAERERLGKDLETIIRYIDQLDQLDTARVEPTSHVIPIQNVLREDEETRPFASSDYLNMAPSEKRNHYEVPKII
ncbi:MAG: Asp-tRNA(Asn)/Glu-tRNA(Gln) amidotransferase GatCAB subunit C [Nitrospinae bacterium CG11_big_fil_rev_8_21_14_0_20_56_8]|nr:MAG: Asp-tRNA(Asn)/Glu-tRNA(Gln) amidotransferase GatCAB subunit C [Nitrospinae bacterium CG11_big_fil_rev_8_21_14_0_20_56_8]